MVLEPNEIPQSLEECHEFLTDPSEWDRRVFAKRRGIYDYYLSKKAELTLKVEEHFGDKDKAAEWLNTKGAKGVPPLRYCMYESDFRFILSQIKNEPR